MLVSDWHLEPIRLCPLIWHWSLKSLFDNYACVPVWHLEPIRLCPLIWHWSLKSLFDSYACVPVWHLEPITSCPLVCVLWLTFIAGELFLHWYSSGWSFTSMAFTTHKGSKCLNHMCSHVKRVKSNTLTTIELYLLCAIWTSASLSCSIVSARCLLSATRR